MSEEKDLDEKTFGLIAFAHDGPCITLNERQCENLAYFLPKYGKYQRRLEDTDGEYILRLAEDRSE